MDFSIMFPTRGRTQLLCDLLRSLEETTADKSNLHVVAGYDLDDIPTCELIPHLMVSYPWFEAHGRNRSNNLSKDYHNWLKDIAKGKYIIIGNDDMVMRTQNWDTIALAKIEAYLSDKPDGIFYGWINDSLITRHANINYCCFPMVSKRAVETIGYAMHPYYTGWNADIHLYHLYASIGRILDLSEVWLDHISYHSGKRAKDEINLNMERITAGHGGVQDYAHEKQLFKEAIRRARC